MTKPLNAHDIEAVPVPRYLLLPWQQKRVAEDMVVIHRAELDRLLELARLTAEHHEADKHRESSPEYVECQLLVQVERVEAALARGTHDGDTQKDQDEEDLGTDQDLR